MAILTPETHGPCAVFDAGGVELQRAVWADISSVAGIEWDCIIDLAKYRVYKPNKGAYLCVEQETGIPPSMTMMVTANPNFGDIEGASSVGMKPCVIRSGDIPTIVALAELISP